MDKLEYAANLLAACQYDRRKKGKRQDNKYCVAKPGECRSNNKYYTVGMNDEKSWSMPAADDTCPLNCGFLE